MDRDTYLSLIKQSEKTDFLYPYRQFLDESDKTTMKLNHLKYFLSAADSLSFAGAERRLNISANSIVRAVNILEQDLGIRIFVRKASQGLVLTEDGHKLKKMAKDLLDDVDEIRKTFKERDLSPRKITVGCVDNIACSLAPILLSSIATEYPDLKIDIKTVPITREHEALLLEGFDVLLTFENQPTNGSLNFDVLFEPTPFAMMREGHPLSDNKTVQLSDLSNYPIIAIDNGPSIDFLKAQFSAVGKEADIQLQTSSSAVSWSMASSTDMIAVRHLLPQQELSPVGKKYTCVPINDVSLKIKVVAVSQAETSRSAATAIKLFRKHCRELSEQRLFDAFYPGEANRV